MSTHELQWLGGWKTQPMVERYAHLAPEGLQAASARIDLYLGMANTEQESEFYETGVPMLEMTFEFPDGDEYWTDQFVASLSADSWVERAKDLVRALHFLREPAIGFWKSLASVSDFSSADKENDVLGVYMMLAAFSFENLFKAIVIRDTGFEADRSKPRLPEALKTHDLVRLAELAHVQLTENGMDLMKRLSRNAVWEARYPAPTKVDALRPSVLSDGSLRPDSLRRGMDIRHIDMALIHCFTKLEMPSFIDTSRLGYGELSEPWEGMVSSFIRLSEGSSTLNGRVN